MRSEKDPARLASITFTKARHVLRGMGLDELRKSESALRELADKKMAPD